MDAIVGIHPFFKEVWRYEDSSTGLLRGYLW